MFNVMMIASDGDTVVWKGHTERGLAHTLRQAVAMIRGNAQCEIMIRRDAQGPLRSHSKPLAWIHTNFKGEIDEIEVYSPITALVTPMNPDFRGFMAIRQGTGSTAADGTKYAWATADDWWRVVYYPDAGGAQAYVKVPGVGFVVDTEDQMPHDIWIMLLEKIGAPLDRMMPA